MALESGADEAVEQAMSAMKRLILTSGGSGAGGLMEARLANCVIPFGPRFVWGQLPSQIELEALLSSRSAMHESWGSHWLDLTGKRHEEARTEGLGLIEFCKRFEAVELWIDPDPNAPTDPDLATGLFAPSRGDRCEADVGLGGGPDRQPHAGRTG